MSSALILRGSRLVVMSSMGSPRILWGQPALGVAGIISGEPMPCYRADGKGIKDCRMVRSPFRSMCGAFLVLAVISGHAEAQRPAAWDTRVRVPPPPPDASDAKSAPERKDKSGKAVDVPAD